MWSTREQEDRWSAKSLNRKDPRDILPQISFLWKILRIPTVTAKSSPITGSQYRMLQNLAPINMLPLKRWIRCAAGSGHTSKNNMQSWRSICLLLLSPLRLLYVKQPFDYFKVHLKSSLCVSHAQKSKCALPVWVAGIFVHLFYL